MTDKQILIDGVDVSGCSELYNGCLCDDGSFYCKDQPNCKFKLEKRGYTIEQITEFTPKKELQETITHLRVLNAELESYNEQLKESQNIEIKENRILREQLKAKEQECEELKEKIKAYDEVYSNHDVLNERNKLKQTLTEIKEIAEHSIDCSYKLSSVINEMHEIKEKISEVIE